MSSILKIIEFSSVSLIFCYLSKQILISYKFSCRKFLRENLYYDEVLAVNVAGQTGLWEILQFLASFRGLHPEVLDILSKIVRSLGEGLVKAAESTIAASEHLPALDCKLNKLNIMLTNFINVCLVTVIHFTCPLICVM